MPINAISDTKHAAGTDRAGDTSSGTFLPPDTWEWGTPACQSVNIDAIISELGRYLADGEVIWAASFVGDPDNPAERKFGGFAIAEPAMAGFAHSVASRFDLAHNNYVSIGASRARATARDTANFAALVCLGLDDIGTKASTPMLPPSLVLETSKNNFQAFYFLREPERDYRRAKALIDAAAAAGFMDPDAKGVNRYLRLPGVNGKPSRKGFKVQVRLWAPERRYSVAEIVAGLALTLAPKPSGTISGPLTGYSMTEMPEWMLAPGNDDDERAANIARALEHIPNGDTDRFDLRHDWGTMCRAIKAACRGAEDGFAAFDRWSQKHPTDNPEATRRFWNSVDNSSTIGWRFILDALWQVTKKPGVGSAAALALWKEFWEPYRFIAARWAFASARAITVDELTVMEPSAEVVKAMISDAAAERAKEASAAAAKEAEDAWGNALRKLSEARTAPVFAAGRMNRKNAFLAFDARATGPVPVRPDITDRHARGEVTMLFSQPGSGKSTWVALLAVAIAWERPDMLGLKSLDWCGTAVLVSNEDGPATIERKIVALVREHGLHSADQRHAILIWPSHLTLVEAVAGSVQPTKQAVDFVEALADIRNEQDVALVVIDTLASALSGLDENSAGAMQAAMNVASAIARAGFLAADILHHTTKAAGDDPSALSYRGSGAIAGAIRSSAFLAPASAADAQKFGWDEVTRKRHVVYQGAKSNDRPPAAKQFFEFASHALGAEDPRCVGTPVIVNAAALRAVSPTLIKAATTEDAYRLLHGAVVTGGEQVLHDTGKRGPCPASADTELLSMALGVSRGEAQRLVRELLAASRIKTAQAWIGGNAKMLIAFDTNSAPPAVPNPDEI